MQGRTHLMAGALASAVAVHGLFPALDWPTYLVTVVVGAVAGVAPDADKAHTAASTWAPILPLVHSRGLLLGEAAVATALWVGRYTQAGPIHPGWPLAATLLLAAHLAAHLAARRLVHHRGVTHSLAALAGLGFGLRMAWSSAPPWLPVALLAGYASHLATDMVTPGGVQLFFPLPVMVTLTGWWPRWLQQPFDTGRFVERVLVRPAVVAGTFAAALAHVAPGLWRQLISMI